MRKSTRKMVCCGAGAFIVTALFVPAVTQAAEPFSVAYKDVLTGDLARTGNSIMTCDRTRESQARCNRIESTTGTIQDDNNNTYTRFIDIDADSSTYNSSAGTLAIPATSQVEWAGLYWSLNDWPNSGSHVRTFSPSSPDNQVRLRVPGSAGYVTVTADWCDTINNYVQCFANVTGLVQAGRSGEYIVANISANTGRDDFTGGWELVSAYRDQNAPLKSLSVQHGHQIYSNNTPREFIFTDFLTPLAGPIDGFVSLSVTDGDAGDRDRARFNYNGGNSGVALSNPLSPGDDLGNGSFATPAGNVLTRRPAFINTLGHDVDEFSIDNFLTNGQTSTRVRLDNIDNNGESNQFYKIGFSVDIYFPLITNEKVVQDLNGGDVVGGDVLEYTITIANSASAFDAAINVQMSDMIPNGLSYVPGSLRFVSGVNGTRTLSDSPGDDEGAFDANNDLVTVNLGTGATSGNGGLLTPGQRVVVSFQVVVDPIQASTDLENTAVVTYEGATLAAGNITRPVSTPSRDPNVAIYGPTIVTASPDPDGDGFGAGSDDDEDDDGILDLDEFRGGLDPDLDSDMDGLYDWQDSDAPGFVDGDMNGVDDRFDADGDGLPNHRDLDTDGDGVLDIYEAGGAALDSNGDGRVDGPDSDMDGLRDAIDPDLGNASLVSLVSDNDGIDDLFDLDDDGDGILTAFEDLGLDGDWLADNTDGDMLPNYRDADDDGDGLLTRFEVADPNNDGDPADARDFDGDMIADFLDADDDGDAILTLFEAADPNGNGNPSDARNTDGDTLPDYLDEDDDGDGALTVMESPDPNGDGAPADALNTDLNLPNGDSLPNYLDDNDDGDSKPTLAEDLDGDGDYDEHDTDGDGTPDWLDADDNDGPLGDLDGDGLTNGQEVGLGTNVNDADSDGDGLCDGTIAVTGVCFAGEDAASGRNTDGDMFIDALDTDDDNDTILTVNEDLDGDGDPADDNSDGDTLPNYLDPDDDNDGVLTADEDIDNDGDPRNDDTDNNMTPNYLDDNDDGDSKPTLAEDLDGDGDYDEHDTDGDGTPDWLDADDNDGPLGDLDGDGLTNGQEANTTMTNPTDADSDGDGLCDGTTAVTGVCVAGEDAAGMRDTDGDALIDALDPDDDDDGVLTADEDVNNNGNPADDIGMNNLAEYLDGCEPDPNSPSCGTGDGDGDGTPKNMDPDDSDPCVPNANALTCDSGDTDMDGLTNGQERQIGTDPENPDSDGDGLRDNIEVANINNPANTDGDALINALDPDDDNDTILTRDEDLDGDDDPRNDNTDGDTLPNYLDPDDDNDGALTRDEDIDNDGDPRNDDTDNDMTPNYLDPDDDGDNKPTLAEDLDGDGDYDEHDTDGDGTPDWLDGDDTDGPLGDVDGDGLTNGVEDGLGTDVTNPDTDGDGLCDGTIAVTGVCFAGEDAASGQDSDGDTLIDALDADDDDDGVDTADEDLDRDGDPSSDDTNRDGIPNYLDVDDDGDGVLTLDEDIDMDGDPTGDDIDMDGTPNYLDVDDDGDNVLTLDEDVDMDGDPTGDDSDMDGLPDYLDEDDDNDAILTRDEDLDGDGDPRNDNSDGVLGDTLPNYLDPDDDGDSVPTLDEDVNMDNDPTNDDSNMDGTPDYLDPCDPDDQSNACLTGDTDGDGTPNDTDPDDHDPCVPDPNALACPTGDTDGDGITNAVERQLRTDPTSADTDGDGLCDGTIAVTGACFAGEDAASGQDSDGDMIIDALDEDDDNDAILTRDEDLDADGDPTGDDSDMDGTPDYLDADDDNDGLLTRDEDLDGDGDPRNDDTDMDGAPNYLDPDDDDDGKPTLDEDLDGDGDYDEHDTDGDGTPNYLDPDDDDGPDGDADGDTIKNRDEDLDGDGDPSNDDTDGDGTPNYLDPDDDNDGILTRDEDLDGDGDPRTDNADALLGDNTPNYLDPDDDGDGVLTIDEDVNMDGDPTNDDSNMDGVVDYLDPCSPDLQSLACQFGDTDRDGYPNDTDPDPLDPCNPDPDALACDSGDSDMDGLTNGEERLIGTNPTIGDSDGDGLLDGVEVPDAGSPRDSDMDGIIDALDDDDDNDGVKTRFELGPGAPGALLDTDMNGVPNYLDPDDDGDGFPTRVEGADPDGDGDPVDALDRNGNTVPDYLDISYPAQDLLDITSPADDATVAPDFTVSGVATPGETVEVFVDGQLAGSAVAAMDGTWSVALTEQTVGEHAIEARTSTLTDAITVTVADVVMFAIVNPTDGATLPVDFTISGTATPGETVEVFVDGESVGTTTADDAGNWSLDVTGLEPGERTITATSGGDSDSITITVDEDAVLPEVDITSPTEGATVASDFTVSGTATPGATVEVFVDGESVGTATADDAGNWSLGISDLESGEHTIEARVPGATDRITVTVDETLEPLPLVILSPADGDTVSPDLTVNGTTAPGAMVEVFVDGESVGTTTADDAGNWSLDVTGLEPGERVITATSSNDGQTASAPGVTVTVEDDPYADLILVGGCQQTRGGAAPSGSLLSMLMLLGLFGFIRRRKR